MIQIQDTHRIIFRFENTAHSSLSMQVLLPKPESKDLSSSLHTHTNIGVEMRSRSRDGDKKKRKKEDAEQHLCRGKRKERLKDTWSRG